MKQNFKCKYCNNNFERNVYKSSKNTFEFCSTSCRNKSRSIPLIECSICKTLFSPKINDINGSRKKYCSSKCANYGKRNLNENIVTSKIKDEFIKFFYPILGAKITSAIIKYSLKYTRNRANTLGIKLNTETYKKIVHGAAKEYMTGYKNPNWHGGSTCKEWGDNWDKQRIKALKRDGYTCQVCWLIDGSNHVHHIRPRRLYTGNIEDANILSNLITLCPRDHKLVEAGKIECPRPIIRLE